jgi:TctA family transporter
MLELIPVGAIDWSTLTTGLTAAFEGAVTSVLPVAGVILAAFVAFKAIRRFVKA